jgi:hypothetical protein
MMKRTHLMSLTVLTLGVMFSATAPTSAWELNLAGSVLFDSDGKGEIVDYIPAFDANPALMAVTTDHSVTVYDLLSPTDTPQRSVAEFSDAFGVGGPFDGVTSTALDPGNRGFGVAAVLPAEYEDDGSTPLHNGNSAGKVGVFNVHTGDVLGYFDVGFHPDSVRFSGDGSMLFVANEGERTVGGDNDAPGSVSLIDLSAVSSLADFDFADPDDHKAVDLGDFTFAADNLAPGVSLDDTRVNDLTALQKYLHIEPEFLALNDDKLYVSLQENSAIGVMDLTSRTWEAVHNLPTIENTIDATDKDDAAVIDDLVAGMPMPDAIASFTIGGKTFIVSANEGDFRGDDADRTRVKDLEEDGYPIDPDTKTALDAIYGDFTDNDALGRLRVSNIDGDTDGDGDIDVLTMPGTRSFSIWDPVTGDLVNDSGSLEGFLLSNEPNDDFHNMNGQPDDFDKRSDDKGPEPEGLDVLMLDDGTVLVAVGMERQNGIVLAQLSDDGNGGVDIALIDYINNFNEDHYAPESLKFVSAADSPTGGILLLVGYEGNDDVTGGVGSVGIYEVVPEPATLAMLGLGSWLIIRRRR